MDHITELAYQVNRSIGQ